MTAEPSLRDHARGAVRDEVMRQAWLLFAEHGFEATTVDQIAASAGMSRRTFFRYFTGKDELVLERMVSAGTQIATALAARPAPEPAWAALRAAFDEIVLPQEEFPDRARRLQLMVRGEPALRAAVQERRTRWQELLEPLVAVRLASSVEQVSNSSVEQVEQVEQVAHSLVEQVAERPRRDPRSHPTSHPDIRPAALTAAALSCLEVAQLAWAEHPGSSLARLLDDAMAAAEGAARATMTTTGHG